MIVLDSWALLAYLKDDDTADRIESAPLCVATARRADAPLWTGDPEIVDQAGEHSCTVVDLRLADG